MTTYFFLAFLENIFISGLMLPLIESVILNYDTDFKRTLVPWAHVTWGLKIPKFTHYYTLTTQLSLVSVLIVILKNKYNMEEIILMREVGFREKILGIHVA